MKPIECDNISKSYGSVQALKGVTLRVDEGEMYGVIGPDGAGKSSLFRILTTLTDPDRGVARVLGLDTVKDYREIRSRIGYMPGKFSLYTSLSVQENVEFFASLFGVTLQQNYSLIAPLYSQIEPFRTRRAGALSGGMKQKLALCCALIHRPEVLILDEPTTGVDAVSRSELWDLLATLREKGITIIVSTPYMDEAARCDRLAMIHEGRILTVDTPSAMANMPNASLRQTAKKIEELFIKEMQVHE